jgi:hypothetical protein
MIDRSSIIVRSQCSCTGSAKLSLTYYQVPDTSFEGLSDPNVTDARTGFLHSTATLPLAVSSGDPHQQPGLPPQHHHAQISLHSPRLGSASASTITIDTGHSLNDDFDSKRKRRGANVGSMPSCEQAPVAGPSSLATAQEPNSTRQDVSPNREERRKKEKERKIREKRERDKNRKRDERSNIAQDNEKICELLDVPLTPKNTLANRSECQCIHSCWRC